MKRLIIAILWLLPGLASAAPTTYSFRGDTWDTLGVVSFSEGQNGAYQAHLSSSAIATVAITNAPWNSNGNGTALDIPAGSTSIPNAGPGVYFTQGNPRGGWLIKGWLKAVALPTGGTVLGGSGAWLRFNTSTGQSFGTDNVADYITPTGQIILRGTASVITANAIVAGKWYYFIRCLQYGVGTTDSESLYINGSKWFADSGFSSLGGGAANFNFDNELGTNMHVQFGPWALFNIGTDSCSTAITNLDASYPGFSTSPLYAQTLYPTSNNSVAWTPSTGTNYSNVNSAPAGANYNSTATNGAQDIYNVATNTLPGTIIGVTALAQMEVDNLGGRVAAPTWKNAGGTVTVGSLQNSLNPNSSSATGRQNFVMANGTYYVYMDGEANSVFTGNAWTPAELGALGVTLVY